MIEPLFEKLNAGVRDNRFAENEAREEDIMKNALLENQGTASRSVVHPFISEDQTAMAAMRVIVEPNKGKLQGTAARVPFDDIIEHVNAPAGGAYEAARIGGVPGWWCRPEAARSGQAIVHLHGGWFNW